MGHTSERIGGAGKAFSGSDAGGVITKRKTRSTGWHVGMVVNKRDMQKEAPKKYQDKLFEEFKELEEQRAKEALKLVHKKHVLTKWRRRKGKL